MFFSVVDPGLKQDVSSGDIVQLYSDENYVKFFQQGHGGWNENMKKVWENYFGYEVLTKLEIEYTHIISSYQCFLYVMVFSICSSALERLA